MFFKHNIVIDNEKTDNNYLVQFYNENSKFNFQLAPKLMQAHIKPRLFEKMHVYLAAQIFSASVSAEMNTHLALGKLTFKSKFTISFIDKLTNF
jgi:hypothetical protein